MFDRFYDIRNWLQHFWQRRTRGWDDTDLYSLDHTVARFVLPRLKELSKDKDGCPQRVFNEAKLDDPESDLQFEVASQVWESYLAEMIYAMEQIAAGACYFDASEKEQRVQKGCELFGKYFRDLWT